MQNKIKSENRKKKYKGKRENGKTKRKITEKRKI